LKRIRLVLWPEGDSESGRPEDSVEALVEVRKSVTMFHLSKYDYFCCEKTTIQLYPQEYELKNLTEFHWKFLCLNGATVRTTSPRVDTFFAATGGCNMEITVKVGKENTQIIRKHVTFHTRQWNSMEEPLRPHILFFKPYLMDISLYNNASDSAIEIGDNQVGMFCGDPIRFEVSKFVSMAMKAFVVIAHRETDAFDIIAISSTHPVHYAFKESVVKGSGLNVHTVHVSEGKENLLSDDCVVVD
uniref:HYDIN protein n=1 Tax=Hydatigena taeniaeformis TaxID=6205 RepID=A0A0R3WWF8_HYDTA